MLKRKEYSNTGKYVFPGIAYDCSLNWYRRFLKSAGNGRVHKKRVSYLYRTATTTYPCLIPHLGESVGAGRIRLTPAQKYEFFVSLQRKKELSAILSLFFESRGIERAGWTGFGEQSGRELMNEENDGEKKIACRVYCCGCSRGNGGFGFHLSVFRRCRPGAERPLYKRPHGLPGAARLSASPYGPSLGF